MLRFPFTKMKHATLGIVFHILMIFQSFQNISSEEQNAQTYMLVDRALKSTFVGKFGVSYNGNVSSYTTDQYMYSYNISDNKQTAVRIYSKSIRSKVESPTIFVIREERSVMSWQIPLLLRYTNEYPDVSRTLCPVDSNTKPLIHREQKLFVEVSTQSNMAVPYSLEAEILTDFLIRTNEKKQVSSSPSNPVYYMYTFPQNVDTVVVSVTSESKLCSVLSIQDTKCPVFDLDKDVEFQGSFQTVTTKGAITVDKRDSDSFYVVLVVQPNDNDCTGAINSITPTQAFQIREKNFTLYIEKTLPNDKLDVDRMIRFVFERVENIVRKGENAGSQYWKAILAAIGVFLAFFFVAAVIGIYYHGCKENWGFVDMSVYHRGLSVEVGVSNSERPLLETAREGYGTIQGENEPDHEVSNVHSGSTAQSNGIRGTDTQSIDSLNSDEFDKLTDVDQDKDIFRTKTALFVGDLSKKSENRTRKKYMLYFKNLVTVSIFYGLPVIQLVLTYQKVLNFTGNQDICYYNSLCSHRLGPVSAFNNVFSNIGYVLLGILFLILVYRREKLHQRVKLSSQGRHKLFGIPQHFGLYYAMGFALCIEGVMSACYHICPTVTNFQFDTSFMYIIACLCILKIYQNRHPDITAKAHSSYLVMAAIIIIAVCGVVYGNNVFWILFALVYMFATLLLSIHLYYMGRWRLDRYIVCRLYHYIRLDLFRCTRPMYLDRMILLAVGLAVNWGLALYGVIQTPSDFATLLLAVYIANLLLYLIFYMIVKVKFIAIYCIITKTKSDFASFLLVIFIGNLVLYTIFYVVAKYQAKEKIPNLTIALIILSIVTWAFALYFFQLHLTYTQLSPAESRDRNRECIILQFYDSHDVWHFLSAMSLFFSFLVIFTLDDEIMLIRRDKIPVF